MVIFIVWIVSILLEPKKLEPHEKVGENKYLCGFEIYSEDTEILSVFNAKKLIRLNIYLRRSRVFNKNMYRCKSDPEKSSATRVSEHVPSGFSMSTIWSFKEA